MKNNLIAISGRLGAGKDLVGEIIQYLVCLDKGILVGKYREFENFRIATSVNEIQSGYKIKKYADKLKDMVCMLIGCTRENLEDRVFKETPIGEEWVRTVWHIQSKHNICETFATEEEAIAGKSHWDDNYGQIVDIVSQEIIMTPRLMLQLLGTECGRNIIHTNIWTNALFADYVPIDPEKAVSMGDVLDYSPCTWPNWIITDMRFPNEIKYVKERGGVTIRVNRFCYDSLEDYLVCYPNPEVAKKAIKIVEQYDYPESNRKLRGMPEATGYVEFSHASETALDNAEFDHVIINDGTIEELIEKIKNLNLV